MQTIPVRSAALSSPRTTWQRDAVDLKSLFDLRRPPGYYNAAAKVALLRRAKKPPHDELLVDFHGPEVAVALKAAGVLLAEGEWTWRATAAGQSLLATGNWEESCWHRDSQCDYLELELKLSAGWRLERQMLLARKDRFLFLGDALIGPNVNDPDADAVEMRAAFSLPLVDNIGWSGAPETREGSLVEGRERRATVIAPALPEWRSEHCHSNLEESESCLSLQQAAVGRSLFLPLWIDLDPARARRALTWRKLTVAENLKVVPRDVAVAYRVHVGGQQWLFYRSLAPRGNRTFLGENFSSEFACLRFLPSGEGEEILSIE